MVTSTLHGGTGVGTLCEKIRRQKQNFFSKALRSAIKLDELYTAVALRRAFRTGPLLFLRISSHNVPNFVLLKRTVATFDSSDLVEFFQYCSDMLRVCQRSGSDLQMVSNLSLHYLLEIHVNIQYLWNKLKQSGVCPKLKQLSF